MSPTTEQIPKNRLEAFSDGVIAIIITIMMLEFRPPNDVSIMALKPLIPTLFSYILSFMYLAIYWNNHHHLLHVTRSIDGRILWANFYLLFWLSLFPFATAWLGKANGAAWPTALYGFITLMAAIAYSILEKLIVRLQGKDSTLAQALGKAGKEKLSILCYLLAIGLAFISAWISNTLYILVALLWIVPDKRIEPIPPS